MSKYIKVFDTIEDYNAYSGGSSFISPNISYVKGADETKYDNNEIKHYTKDSWIEVMPKEEYTATSISSISTYMTKLEIPNSVTIINNYAFNSCSRLTSVKFPSGVTYIGASSFSNCSGLTSIDIPSNIYYIESMAFQGCSGLTSVIIRNPTPPTLGSTAFNNTNNCPIYVPSESVEAYKGATNWSSYASRIQAIPSE